MKMLLLLLELLPVILLLLLLLLQKMNLYKIEGGVNSGLGCGHQVSS